MIMSTIAHSSTAISDSTISRGILMGMVLLFVLLLTFFFYELPSQQQTADLQSPRFEKTQMVTNQFGR